MGHDGFAAVEFVVLAVDQQGVVGQQLAEVIGRRLVVAGRQRGQQLQRYTEELEQQIAEANEMLRTFRRPSPMQRMNKVVNLPLASRKQRGSGSA